MKENNLPMKREQLLEEQKRNFIKALNLRTVIMLVVLLAFNSFAWFIYASQVNTSLSVHVAGWNVQFDQDTTSTPFIMSVASAYPGMTTFTQSLNMSNGGEVDAHLSFTIIRARVGTTVYDTETQPGVTSESSTQPAVHSCAGQEAPWSASLPCSNAILTCDQTPHQLSKWPF